MSWNGKWFGVSSGGGGGGTAELVSQAPSGELHSDPDTARWTPIVTELTLRTDDNLFIVYISGGNRWIVYDPDNGFSPWFADKSTLVADGDNLISTVLPNGGWQSPSFKIEHVSGLEMSLA